MAKAQSNNTKSKTKKKPRASTAKGKKNDKVQTIRKEISGIFIIAIGIFLIVMMNKSSQTGIVGNTISIIMTSALGKAAKILPYVVLLIGIMPFLDNVFSNNKNRIVAIIIILVCYIMYTTLYDVSAYSLITDNKGFIEFYNSSVELGKTGMGGGAIGNIFTFIFVKLVGKNGTMIILYTMIFVSIILFTNQSVIGAFKIVTSFMREIFKKIYNFVFIDVNDDEENEDLDQDENIIEKPLKKNKKSKIENKKGNVKVFDYTIDTEEPVHKKTKKTVQLEPDEYSNVNMPDEKNDVAVSVINEVKPPVVVNVPDIIEVASVVKDDTVENKVKKEKTFQKQDITDDKINIAGVKNENNISTYKFPSIDLLDTVTVQLKSDRDDLKREAEKLIATLADFNIQCNIVQINKGPTITRYELQPAPGIKISRITSLTNDLALSLAAPDIRMEAPIPGKSAIGIEVPNKVKTDVYLRSLIESKEYKEIETKVPFALGKDITGNDIIGNIEKMPHLLVAGATGSGKSVCINSLIMSILFKAKPDEVKLILIDPKVVELSVYNGIPHLLIPVVTDARKASNALGWAVAEMTSRYKIFAASGVRDIFSYNKKIMLEEDGEKMPQIVIIIDELADLMAVASSEVEESITRIAQLARACGIHLVIATQRPSVDVITGVIKANIPSRIAFAVSSYIDSRTILDTNGAEKLLGKGDMLYHPTGLPKPIRIQGTFISDDEIRRVVDKIIEQRIEMRTNKINEEIEKTPSGDVDELLERIIETVVLDGQASTSYIQRKFKIGYSRAARIMDQLEERGIVSSPEGSKSRKVLVTVEELEEMKGGNNG